MQVVDGESQSGLDQPVSRPQPAKRGAGERYIDTFFRHWMIALIPVLVLPLGGLGLAFLNRGGSTATTNVYVNEVSTKQLGYVDPLATPATNAATALTQLLQTQSFDVLVARGSPLYWSKYAQMPNRDNLIVSDLSKNVVIVAKGPNFVNITYSSKQPLMATQLLGSVINQAPRQIAQLNQQQSAGTVAFYTRRMKDAQHALAVATKQLGSYMKKHHLHASEMAAQSLFDPAFAALYQAVQSAQVDINNADQQISKATSQSGGGTFQVYDPPSAMQASLSKKSLVLDLAIGLAVGLLICGAFVVATTAFDHSLRRAQEVPELLGVPVLASIAYSEALAREHHPRVSVAHADISGPGYEA